jgi:hypothetical protein
MYAQTLPSFLWANPFGNSIGNDEPLTIITDLSGNVYTSGNFTGTVDFDPGSGLSSYSGTGNYNMYITKYSPDGNFIWAKALDGNVYVRSIELDDSSNIYLTGYFDGSIDFDPGTGIQTLTSTMQDIFLLKLDSTGNFNWAFNLGGPQTDGAKSVSIDNSGDILLTGYFTDTVDFDPGPSNYDLATTGINLFYDIFVAKYSTAGSLIWAKNYGGTDNDYGTAITSDLAGNICITGYFTDSIVFDSLSGELFLSPFSNDIFILKLNSSGDFIWSKQMGGIGIDFPMAISVDQSGNIYSTGQYMQFADFDPGPATYLLDSMGGYDIYISKLDSAGNFLWAKGIGSSSSEYVNSMVTDLNGNLYLTGWYINALDFDPGPNNFNLSSNGLSDIFDLKLNVAGDFQWAFSLGGSGRDHGNAITLDFWGNIFTTGFYNSIIDFDPGSASHLSLGGVDVDFIQKLGQTSVGISQIITQPDFIIFPNPSSGSFTIPLKMESDITMSIFNTSGQLISRNSFLGTNLIQKTLIVPKGIYIVNLVNSSSEIVNLKLIVDKNSFR